MKDSKILIIDDDSNISKSIELTLKTSDHQILAEQNPSKARTLISENDFDAVILDVYLGNQNGLDILRKIKEEKPFLPVIMISGLTTLDEAMDCISQGAYDFIPKPIEPHRLIVSVENAVNLKKMKQQMIGKTVPICESQSMKNVLSLAEKVSRTTTSVLITGESGSGKDLIANLIHALSRFSEKKMIKINCGAIPENLIESELFGYEKGSFTGAEKDSIGKIQAAEGGSLFLDEIGELPLSAQVKLLRFLENGEIQRLGQENPTKVNTRIIAATNRDLLSMVEKNLFREDLYYRLNVIEIKIPSLKERIEDIEPLVLYFSASYCESQNLPLPQYSDQAMRFFKHLNYTGNIRELRNLVERTIIMNVPSTMIDKDDVCLSGNQFRNDHADLFNQTLPLSEAKKELEKKYILTQLTKFNNRINETAEALDVLPTNLCRRIRTLGLEKDNE